MELSRCHPDSLARLPEHSADTDRFCGVVDTLRCDYGALPSRTSERVPFARATPRPIHRSCAYDPSSLWGRSLNASGATTLPIQRLWLGM